MSWFHVVPVNDLKPHDTASLHCKCGPQIDWNDMIIVHRSYDGREIIEQAEEIIQTDMKAE